LTSIFGFKPHRGWKDLSWLTLAQGMSLLLGFLQHILWARLFPLDTYGYFQLFMSLISIASSFSLNGLAESASLSAARGLDGNLNPICRLRLGVDLAGSVALMVMAAYYHTSAPELAIALGIASALHPLANLRGIIMNWRIAQGKFRSVAIWQTIEPVLIVILIGLSGFYHWFQPGKIGLLVIVIQAALTAGLWAQIYGERTSTHRTDFSIIKYGLFVSFIGWLAFLGNIDKAVLEKTLSAEAIAIYAMAQVFPVQLKTLLSLFVRYITPRIYAAPDVAAAWNSCKRLWVVVWLVFILIGVVGYFVLPYLIQLFFSDRYAASAGYAKILWLWWGITSPSVIFYNILVANRQKAFMAVHQIGYPLLMGGMFLFMIPRFGITGAVAANLITAFISGSIHLGYFIWAFRKAKRAEL